MPLQMQSHNEAWTVPSEVATAPMQVQLGCELRWPSLQGLQAGQAACGSDCRIERRMTCALNSRLIE